MKCKNEYCNTHAHYGYERKKPLFCAKHKFQDMTDVMNVLCNGMNCSKRAYYGIEKTPIHCKEHRQENEINVVKGFCKETGCKIKPTFGNKNKKPLYCFEHKKEGMYNVMKNTCNYEDCELQASYGFIWNNPIYCSKHKHDDMKDVIHKRCNYENCEIQPCYGYSWKKPISCLKHKNDTMRNVCVYLCESKNCVTTPSFGEIWMKPLRCHEHKLINDKNVTHKSCKTELCETIGNPKYKGYCLRCFINIFPNEKISRNFKIKEQHLVDSIKQNFLNEKMIIDKIVDGGCSRRRPDIVIDKYTHVIIIECDENQHNQKFYTECDNKRLMELFQDFGSRPLVMIKFNPDKYVDKFLVKHSSCFSNHTKFDVPLIKRDEFNKRIEKLSELLVYTITTIPEKEITIHHLFYDENNSM
jgi:Holliday junction resolvase